jgi:predicted metal-binding membrane protein
VLGLRVGLGQGAYCLGCCWALMALLFVVSAMGLVGVGARGVRAGREGRGAGSWMNGVVLLVWAVWLGVGGMALSGGA